MSRISLPDFAYPAHDFPIGKHVLRYVDTHPETQNAAEVSGPTLVCVHGNPTWSYYYRRVIDAFAGRMRVIAVDNMGCGRSDKPNQQEFDYTLASHRDNLIELLDRLELQRVILLVHDWGGAIGLSAGLARLDQIAGLCVLNTGAFPPPYLPWRIAACRWPGLGPLAVRGLNAFALAALTMAVNRKPLTAQTRRGLIAPYDSWKSRVAIDAFVKDIPMRPAHPTHATLLNLEKDLERFRETRVSIVWGMKDWCFRPECLDRFVAAWPHACVNRLDDCGHYVLEEAPDAVIEALEHLQSRAS
ncbi:MAG: alpha/beta fold hydrolase [Planctomycetota bacterium]